MLWMVIRNNSVCEYVCQRSGIQWTMTLDPLRLTFILNFLLPLPSKVKGNKLIYKRWQHNHQHQCVMSITKKSIRVRHNGTISVSYWWLWYGDLVYHNCEVTDWHVGDTQDKFPDKFNQISRIFVEENANLCTFTSTILMQILGVGLR